MAKKIIRFAQRNIEEETIRLLEQAAVNAPGLSGTQPYFFIFMMNQAYIHEFEMLAESEGAALQAPLAVCAFSKTDEPDAFRECLLVLGEMTCAARSAGVDHQYVSFFGRVFNEPAYGQLKTACGVPEGYACAAAAVFGYGEETVETDVKYSIFSYIQ